MMHQRAVIIPLMMSIVCTGSAIASVGGATVPEPAPETDGLPEFLFQIVAARATFDAGAGSFDGVLTLENVNNKTIVFSDRPDRIAGTVPTDELVFGPPADGPDSFSNNPPNAAFSCSVGAGDVSRAVFVLYPPYESHSGAVSFEVDVLYASDPEASFVCEGLVRVHCVYCPRHA